MRNEELVYEDLTVGEARRYLLENGVAKSRLPSTKDSLATLYDMVKRVKSKEQDREEQAFFDDTSWKKRKVEARKEDFKEFSEGFDDDTPLSEIKREWKIYRGK